MSLSRGRKFTGEWIVGIHATGSKNINQEKEYICPVVRSVGYDPIGQIHLGPFYEVEAGTVGACSEVNDTAGIAIFAGDVLESRASENPEDWRRWVVEYEDGAFGFRTKAGKRNYIENTIIEKDCSPAAALGFAQNDEEKHFETTISVPTIYSYIRKGVFLRLTMKDLPRHGEVKAKYQHLNKEKTVQRAPAGESIEKRPEEVKDRDVFGHWEMDTVYSAKNTSKEALLMLTERKTREEIIIKLKNRMAETVVKALDGLERKWGAVRFRMIFQSITVDNGSEFAAVDALESSCINKTIKRTKLYFCHPYSSWEQGSNENQNGMVRRKHPKGTDFAKVSNAELAETQEWLNNYPRKIFGYKTSEMMFRECLAELGIAA